MKTGYIVILLSIVFTFGVLAIDTWMKKRAIHRNRNGRCARCDAALSPVEWKEIGVYGLSNLSRVCANCYSRDKKVAQLTYILVASLFILAAYSLWRAWCPTSRAADAVIQCAVSFTSKRKRDAKARAHAPHGGKTMLETHLTRASSADAQSRRTAQAIR